MSRTFINTVVTARAFGVVDGGIKVFYRNCSFGTVLLTDFAGNTADIAVFPCCFTVVYGHTADPMGGMEGN